MIPYLVGFVIYILSVVVSYSNGLKQTHWFFPIGLILAVIVNFLWLYIAKESPLKDQLYVRALIWDSMIVGAYVLVPLVLYGVRPTGYTLAGCVFIVLGLILTKLG
jgi:hypothetical protein